MKKKKIIIFIVLITLAAFGVYAAGNQESSSVDENNQASDDYYPLNFKYSNGEFTVKEKPKRVIVFNYEYAEMLAALGVEDTVIAVRSGNYAADAVLPEYREGVEKIPQPPEVMPAGGFPSLENIISLQPDLFILPSYYFNVESMGKPEDYKAMDINLYMTEGTTGKDITIEKTYQDILNLGKIFNKTKEATAIVDGMKARIAKIKEKNNSKKNVSILVFDSIIKGEVATAGGSGLENDMINIAGGNNLYSDIDKQFLRTSIEDFISSDPDIIIVHAYGKVDNYGEDKLNQLKTAPEYANLTAVKNNKIYIVPLISIFPSIQNIDFIETLSNAIAEF